MLSLPDEINDNKINEKELDQEGDHDNNITIIIKEVEGHESVIDLGRKWKYPELPCIEDKGM